MSDADTCLVKLSVEGRARDSGATRNAWANSFRHEALFAGIHKPKRIGTDLKI